MARRIWRYQEVHSWSGYPKPGSSPRFSTWRARELSSKRGGCAFVSKGESATKNANVARVVDYYYYYYFYYYYYY